MPATPAEAADFRELLGQLASELVRPINDSYRQLAELLRDPTPVIPVAGDRCSVISRSVGSTDGIVKILDPDPSRIGVVLSYDNTAGNVSVYGGFHDQISQADAFLLPPPNSQRWLPLAGGFWVFSTGASRPVQVLSVYR